MNEFKLRNIHLFEANNTFLMLNSDTLDIYELDELTYCELGNYITNGTKMSDELEKQLKNTGLYLKSETYFNEVKENKLISNNGASINSIVLEIVNACNMKCKYCYGNGGELRKK
jgi:uncharacterized protein